MDADGTDVAKVTTNSVGGEPQLAWQPLPRTVRPPDTGGMSLLLVASALLFSVGVLFNAVVRRRI